MESLQDRFFALGVIPVIAIDNVGDAVPLCGALMDGGLPVAEITFRTSAAEKSIRAARQAFPEMLVGAGTVTNVAMAAKARDAGSLFIVTPGFNPEVVSWCLEENMPVFPGCTTASEVEAAMNMNLGVVKFFPAEQSGGLAKIKALNGPYPNMRFMPTGGIGLGNLSSYLAYPGIVACGGSFMVPQELLRAKDWNGVKTLANKAVTTALGLEIIYAGPLCRSGDVDDAARQFGRITRHMPVTQNGSVLGGPVIITGNNGKSGFRIGFSAPSVTRVKAYYDYQGVAIDPTSIQRDASGQITGMSLNDDIAGCRVDVVKR